MITFATILTSYPAFAVADSPVQPPHSIRVVARATVRAAPDRARMTVGVTTEGKTATAAAAENARRMEKVLAVLKKELGANGEIKTAEVNVRPRFEELEGEKPAPRILGYKAVNTVNIQVTDLRAVSRLLDAAFQSGANTVENLEFTLKDAEAAQNQAVREASMLARRRASALAVGQGLRVGEVISVVNDDDRWPWASFAEEGDLGFRNKSLVPTPLEPGMIEVHASVTVTFALKTAALDPGP